MNWHKIFRSSSPDPSLTLTAPVFIRHVFIRRVLISMVLVGLTGLGACSSGPADKPVQKSISSPAQLLDQGIQQYNDNNYQHAISYFEKSLLQYRSIDNQLGIAQNSLNIAKSLMAINNHQLAAQYLLKADAIIEQANLNGLTEHSHLLKSSLAISEKSYDEALQELEPVLYSKQTDIQLAALKNRTEIAFIKNDNDKQTWLDKYKKQQQRNPDTTRSHQARILRFEAKQANDKTTQQDLLQRSLNISRQLANRPAIAATLKQWAEIDIETENFADAEDKVLRALFIRHQLGDVKNSRLLLERLDIIYQATGNKKRSKTKIWIDKLSKHDLNDWDSLFSDFENYPKTR